MMEHSLGQHDVGGQEVLVPLDLKEQPVTLWEKQTHALLVVLAVKGFTTTDEHRRAIEALPAYSIISYYHKWAAGITAICVKRGTFTKAEMDAELGTVLTSCLKPSFNVGDQIRIKNEDSRVRWRKPHLRTPGYIFGVEGEITRMLGTFPNPEEKAFHRENATMQPLYLVQMKLSDIWKNYPVYEDHAVDSVTVEVYEPWIEQIDEVHRNKDEHNVERDFPESKGAVDHGDHFHDERKETEIESLRRETAAAADGADEEGEMLSNAVMNLLVAKGIVVPNEIRACIESMDSKGIMNYGQQIVVRAWLDQDFKARLVEDGNAGCAELGLQASNPNAPTKLVVVENTPQEQ